MYKFKKKGNLFIISSPSGAGKSTLASMVLKDFQDITYSISCTTRSPRLGEKDKLDYFFLDEKEFKKNIKQNKFLEWAIVHNNYYGTPKEFIINNIEKGIDVILVIDVQGCLKIKKKIPESISIYILPPSMKELKKRLKKRGLDSDSVIAVRLKNAIKELSYLQKYDYLIINNDIYRAFFTLKSIINAHRSRSKRYDIKKVIDTFIKDSINI